VELKRPTWVDLVSATQLNSDLRYEQQVLIRTNGASGYSAPQMPLEMFFQRANPLDPKAVHPFDPWRTKADLDVLISWEVPGLHGHEFYNGQPVSHGP
jgi:hypothetical protein